MTEAQGHKTKVEVILAHPDGRPDARVPDIFKKYAYDKSELIRQLQKIFPEHDQLRSLSMQDESGGSFLGSRAPLRRPIDGVGLSSSSSSSSSSGSSRFPSIPSRRRKSTKPAFDKTCGYASRM